MIQAGFMGNLYDSLVNNYLLDETSFLPISNPSGVFEVYRKEQIDQLNEKMNVKISICYWGNFIDVLRIISFQMMIQQIQLIL